jgi:hypothetical protein
MAASAFGQVPGGITTVADNGNFGNYGDAGLAAEAPPGAAHEVVVNEEWKQT